MKKHQSGIALLEAMLATLILAIGLVGAIGLQAKAYSLLSGAGARAEATIAAEKLIGVMNNDQANIAAYNLAAGGAPGAALQNWYDETRILIPNAAITVATGPAAAGIAGSKVVVSISWIRKTNEPTNSHTVTAYIAPST
ncbi:type IV pilus assembly protein PilV [Oxalobacteraceae bacterium GrIS 1.11]